MDIEINGKKFNLSDAINLICVGVLSWICWTLIEHDNAITKLQADLETINKRGTEYVQNEVMEKLTEIQIDIAGLGEKIEDTHP